MQHDKQKKALVLQFTPEHESDWLRYYLEKKNPEFKIMEPRE